MTTDNRKLKELQQHWYKKLKDSGFKDIEDVKNPYNPLKRSSSHMFINLRKTLTDGEMIDYINNKAFYFTLAQEFLNEHQFLDEYERYVWEKHSNGESNRSIERLFLKEKKKSTYREKVRKVVNSLKKAMLDKYRKQANE
jgi:hypothetical protein